jgi:glutaredoxin 3
MWNQIPSLDLNYKRKTMTLTVYSKNNCQFCTKAKFLLNNKGVVFEEIKIDEDPAARELMMSAGHRTVPQIYLDGKIFVEGGYTGLAKLEDSVFETLKDNTSVN